MVSYWPNSANWKGSYFSLPQTPPLKQDGSYRTIRAVSPGGRSESMETALVTVMNNAG
jgi:hypothetical protein